MLSCVRERGETYGENACAIGIVAVGQNDCDTTVVQPVDTVDETGFGRRTGEFLRDVRQIRRSLLHGVSLLEVALEESVLAVIVEHHLHPIKSARVRAAFHCSSKTGRDRGGDRSG